MLAILFLHISAHPLVVECRRRIFLLCNVYIRIVLDYAGVQVPFGVDGLNE